MGPVEDVTAFAPMYAFIFAKASFDMDVKTELGQEMGNSTGCCYRANQLIKLSISCKP